LTISITQKPTSEYKFLVEPLLEKTWPKFNFRRKYREHNIIVQATAPRDRLLVMNVKEGWEPVCKLLGQPIPNCGFPFRNKGGKNGQTEEFLDELMQSHIRRCKIEVASAILIIFAIPVLLAYLFQPNIDILFK